MRRTTDEILMRRYLLGDLPQDERARLEHRYLADAEVFEELLATENDMIDSYVRGELTESERQKFEVQYAESARQGERVEFGRVLREVSALVERAVPDQRISLWQNVWAAASVQHQIPQWALAAAAVVVVGGGSWLITQHQRLRVDMQQALTGQATVRRQETALRQHIAELEGSPPDQTHQNQQGSEVATLETPTAPEVTLRLTPGMARGPEGRQSTLILPPIGSSIQLQLMLDRDESAIYQVVMRTAEGGTDHEINRKELKSRRVGNQRAVVLALPSNVLRPGDYIVTLIGRKGTTGVEEEVEAYTLHVMHR